ncbi:MAG: hypothetical protein KF781_04175 [Chitinophagaceae bacterium]|nr:hypothetical protein [Chitinophagaceae bacterium]MCW5904717.1 hypothetical protein [Chitinophagaceae bacterium]
MKQILKRITAVLVIFFIVTTAAAQQDTSSVKSYIKLCADSMLNSFLKKDYRTMAKFSNETIVDMMGGEEAYASTIETTMSEGDMAEVKLEEAKVGNILQVVKTDAGFQCIVQQKVVMVLYETRVISISPLHGYSNKEGKHWRFMDVGGQTAESLEMYITDFDKRLVIPKKETSMEAIE